MVVTGPRTLTEGHLSLRPFSIDDLNDFSALHADPDVMRDLGGPTDHTAAQDKLTTYITAFQRHGYGRWAVFDAGDFVGYVGVMHQDIPDHPLGPHNEIGWRLHRAHWGKDIATRAAALALTDAFDRAGLQRTLAYTAPDNLASQAVMTRLGMSRAAELDFSEDYPPLGTWKGLVWRLTAADWASYQRSGGSE